MAHRTTHRRNLAAPPSSSADSPPTTSFTATPFHHLPQTSKPDLTHPSNSKPSSLLNHFSALSLNPKHSHHPQPQPLPPYVDTHLQAKPITASAIFDSSKSSLLKSNTHHAKLAPKLEKESKPVKKTSKEKPQKPSSQELERRRVHQGVFKSEKVVVDDSDSGLKIEDDVVKRPSVSLVLSGGRRRSFCGTHVDLGDVFAINGVKVVSADMPPFMQIHAVDCARKTFDSMEKFTSKTLALTLKKEFDGVYGPAWHCIVGTSFGSFVTHSVGGFLYFSMDQKLYILLFKTTVQKAD